MNTCTIIGNLTRDPEIRDVNVSGGSVPVCTFTVAVNRRGSAQDAADFFTVSAWRKLGETCHQYLAKGRKVYVRGTVTARAYAKRDGNPGASLELTAEDVEFLTPRNAATEAAPAAPEQAQTYTDVTGTEDDLPF